LSLISIRNDEKNEKVLKFSFHTKAGDIFISRDSGISVDLNLKNFNETQ